MCKELLLPVLMTAVPIVTLTSWSFASKFAGKDGPCLSDDLKSLFLESMPFLKTQWFFLALCAFGGAVSSFQYSHAFILPAAITTASMVCTGIVPILKLFYVSYLASPKNPALVSTIGIWAMILYLIGEYIQNIMVGAGLVFFIAPGLYVMARTSLFLPIYAVEGHRPLKAIDRSWEVTKGRFWQISLYLGPPTFVVLGSHIFLPFLGTMASRGSEAGPLLAATGAVTSMAGILLDILLAGLMYKLYLRFNSAQKSATKSTTT